MTEDYCQYTTRFFSRWAPFYNLITTPVAKLRDKVVNMAEVKKDTTVLDVCTGTGGQAFAFAKRGCEVIGIDLSPDMLGIAKRTNIYKNVRFETADATSISFRDNSFDISCISLALHDMPFENRHKVLDEMKRVSQKIIVIDYHIPMNKFERWLHVSATSLYESKYYKDFARQDLNELLGQHDLQIYKEAYGLINFIKIVVCEASIS